MLLNDERIRLIVKYIIEHFDQKTYRNSNNAAYSHDIIVNVEDMAKSKHNTVKEKKEKREVKGFNSIFAVSSIKAAKKYYKEFQKQISETSSNLKVATIFSFVQNDNNDNYDDTIQEENFEPKNLDEDSREFLESAIKDYNQIFKTNYDTSDEKFENYYKDVSLQMKNNQIDILIVVNMFLTGFDAPTLNTLWVDKRLQMHGLIQAFSRTNRILNSVKTFGNIVSFMNLEENTNKALSVFGDKDANSIALLKTYKDYFNGYDENGEHVLGYTEIVDLLKTKFPINEAIVTEEDKKLFIKLFGDLLKIRNTLSAFNSFREDREKILSDIDFQDYSGKYSDLYTEITQSKNNDKNNPEIENIQDDVVFEIELIKQVEVNIDYILLIVARYKNENKDKDTIIEHVRKLINAGIELRSKRELIENFINQMNASDTGIQEEFYQYVKEEKEKDLIQIIKGENLKEKETNDFITSCFEYGEIRTSGTDIDKILPPKPDKEGDVVDNPGKKESPTETITPKEWIIKFIRRLSFFIGLANAKKRYSGRICRIAELLTHPDLQNIPWLKDEINKNISILINSNLSPEYFSQIFEKVAVSEDSQWKTEYDIFEKEHVNLKRFPFGASGNTLLETNETKPKPKPKAKPKEKKGPAKKGKASKPADAKEKRDESDKDTEDNNQKKKKRVRRPKWKP